MESGNNSSSLHSSSGSGEDVDLNPPTTFFPNATASWHHHLHSSTHHLGMITNNNQLYENQHQDPLPSFHFRQAPPPSNSMAPPPPPPTTSRSSKKRPRASRRAPTTVLTTDTTNFRAMVQEFTGIPSPPPFTPASTSSFPLSRFHFFNSPPINSPLASSSPQVLLKPYPQKFNFQPPLPPPPSSSLGPGLSLHSLPQSSKTQQTDTSLMMPTTSADLDYGAADLRMLPGLIGSGWGQDAAADPTTAASNSNMSSKVKGGGGMLESWLCSSD